MGILVNKILTIGSGIQIPVNSLVVADVSIAAPTFYRERENLSEPEGPENPPVQKYRRVIRYSMRVFQSIAVWKDSDGMSTIVPNEIPLGWAKEISDAEYTQLIDNGFYAEVWLAEHLDEVLGGDFCSVVNALEEEN